MQKSKITGGPADLQGEQSRGAGKNLKYKSKVKGSPALFDSAELKEFLALLNGTDVVEFEYGDKGVHIVIKKEAVGEIIGDEISPGAAARREKYRIKSSVVGLFHLVENDIPLCSVGDVVKEGRKLGWVDSMGIPKEIVAERAGRIVSIFCKDSGVVEWGQDLFEIDYDPPTTHKGTPPTVHKG